MIDLYLFFRPIILGSVSPLSVPGAHARDRSFPAPGSERNGENIYIFFRICLLPAQFFFTVNISSIHEPSCVLPQASSLHFFPKRFFPSSYAHTISTPTHTHSLTTNPGCSKYTNGQTPSKSLRLPLLTPPPSCKQAKKKKNGQKKNSVI